ncbi:exported hypothetical protein [Candidatus Nitrospira nitrificans]|uniref:Uncharacterized protein n=1 Tax=Candidatus Nitrospira nitrificans TaxID=1742973 RepID=A0A0S4LK38_9BACT|nr:exported hypothetical protein [Candidatus Nitrospira nitrificans]
MRSRSGATIQTSPMAASAFAKAAIPGDWIPSSLVTRMRMVDFQQKELPEAALAIQ